MVSPFDLSRTLLVGGGLLVPCSLPGPPVIKQLTQMVTVAPGRGGGSSHAPLAGPLWFHRSGRSVLHPLGQVPPQPVLVGPTS